MREFPEIIDLKISVVGKEDWHDFSIPGSAMQSFMDARVIADPYIGTNEYDVRDFLHNDFIVKGNMRFDKAVLAKKHKELVFKSVDTVCDVYLNSKKLGHMESMHLEHRFDVSSILEEENIIEFVFTSAITSVSGLSADEDREITMKNTGTMYGSHAIRKAHSMYGWDWGPQLPDCGIYEPVALDAYDELRLDNVWIRQDWNKSHSLVTLDVIAEGVGIQDSDICIRVYAPDESLVGEGWGKAESEACSVKKLAIENPQLWWPNGYGEQPLYRVELNITRNDEKLFHEEEIGLRTLTVARNGDQWGREFTFIVNGVRIFARGADLIPDDCFYGRITRQVIERDIRAAKFANFNCLRVWGGGYYPKDYFYELCDREGIVIWQDFMFACNVYDLTLRLKDGETLERLIEKEAVYEIKRLRNYASLGLLCGNNEMELAWISWEETKYHSETLKKDYTTLFEGILPALCEKYAPDTFYWPSSPSTNGGFFDPDNENDGDSHYWQVWHGMKPFTDYRNHFFRFCSEFGFQSFPSLKTLKTFAFNEDDYRLDSRVMESHQKNPSANAKILAYLKEYFNEPKDFCELILLSQIMQGIAMKTAVDHMRRNRGRCMGALYWQFNDNWPVASWSSMDYYGRYKVLHYMARRFYAPVSGSIAVHGSSCEAWVSNETDEYLRSTGTVKIKELDFTVLYESEVAIEIPPFTAKKVFEGKFEQYFSGGEWNKDWVFIEFKFDGLREWETFLPIKEMRITEPVIKVTVENSVEKVELKKDHFVPFVFLEGSNEDFIFEDNAFAITEPVTYRTAIAGLFND